MDVGDISLVRFSVDSAFLDGTKTVKDGRYNWKPTAPGWRTATLAMHKYIGVTADWQPRPRRAVAQPHLHGALCRRAPGVACWPAGVRHLDGRHARA